jgi:5''-nucleotidase/2'',3''-cyclic phosphodiesterase and related esterases
MRSYKLAVIIALSLGLFIQCQGDDYHRRKSVNEHEERYEIKDDQGKRGKTIVKIVAFNDFHGQLESPGIFRQTPTSPAATDIPVGGVDWMMGYIDDLKSRNRNTLVVSAGDIIGATPLVSALFHDEGTIETMNRLGLEYQYQRRAGRPSR